MHCGLTCDCGAELCVEDRTDNIGCPQCGAQYAVTITKIGRSAPSQQTE